MSLAATTTASPRSLGSGSFTADGDVQWSVEKPLQRLRRQEDEALAEPATLTSTALPLLQEEFAALSGLEEDDVKLFWEAKNEKNRRASLTPTTSTCSSSNASISSSEDDTASLQSSSSSSCCEPVVVQLTEADLYGQRHPIESKTLIAFKLHQFEEQVKQLCPSKKEHLLAAETRCSDLVTARFKLMFLRCECFHAEVRGLGSLSIEVL